MVCSKMWMRIEQETLVASELIHMSTYITEGFVLFYFIFLLFISFKTKDKGSLQKY